MHGKMFDASRRLPFQCCLVGLLSLAAVLGFSRAAPAQDEGRLSEQEVVTLLKFFDAPTVISKLERGVAFSADEETLKRLKEAGASQAVLDAVKQAAQKPEPQKAVAYQDVVNLLKAGVPEARIRQLLSESPTNFVLGAGQERELRRLGASDRLIAALQGDRSSGGPEKVKISDLAIILDCSGSMAEKTSDGHAKMNVAKRVVADLVQSLPEGLHVTFLIYGHDKQLGCQGVKVARPLSPIDGSGKSELATFIGALQPASKTPIALSLRTAYEQLSGRDAECGLILISDGKETCGGDPRVESARLANDLNCRFGVNVVGFDVDAEGRAELEEVARAGGGAYFNAQDAAELSEKVLPRLTKKVDEAAIEPAINVESSPISKVTVKPFRIEGFPKIEKVMLIKADGYRNIANMDPVVSTEQLGDPMVAPPGKYDLLFDPSVGSWRNMPILVKDLEVKSRRSIVVDPNRLLAGVRVAEIDGVDVRKIHLLKPGSRRDRAGMSPVITTEGCDKIMLVRGGAKYDVMLDLGAGNPLVPLLENYVPDGGALNQIGGEENTADSE